MSEVIEYSLTDKANTQYKSLYEMVGQGYEDFWWWNGRYTVLKGS